MKTELTSLERKIELSLKPIEQSEEVATKPENEPNTLSVPGELQQAKEIMGDRLQIGHPATGTVERKGFKI